MAGKGGKRPGAGRKAKPKVADPANKQIAAQVLALACKPIHVKECRCELCKWWFMLHESGDLRVQFDALKYLSDKRDGKAVQTVNHVHDKPIEMTVNLSMSEVVRKVRERKAEYERSR